MSEKRRPSVSIVFLFYGVSHFLLSNKILLENNVESINLTLFSDEITCTLSKTLWKRMWTLWLWYLKVMESFMNHTCSCEKESNCSLSEFRSCVNLGLLWLMCVKGILPMRKEAFPSGWTFFILICTLIIYWLADHGLECCLPAISFIKISNCRNKLHCIWKEVH